MTLCFGVFATILKKASSDSVTNRDLVSRLVGTIDPDHLYGDGDHDDSVSKLMSGSGNFPKTERSESFSSIRESSGSTTCIIPKSHDTDPEDLAVKFETSIVSLLSEDKKRAAIGALQHVIRNDEKLKKENIRTFESYIGTDYDSAISTSAEINLPRFLAGIFLYILSINKNSKESVQTVKAGGFFESFADYLVTYTNTTIPTFTVAPDDCGDYLEKLETRYGTVPILIYKNNPQPFYDVYVQGDLEYKGEKIEKAGIAEILRIGKSIIFTGTGGQGKSMLMQHLLLDAVSSYDETGLMPIFISVKDFDGVIPDILQCSHAFIRNLWPELSMDELQTMFIDGKVLLLFDGLDEIRPDLLASFTSALNAFLDRYLDNGIILSSRPYENFGSFSRCEVITLRPFSLRQATLLVEKLNYPPGKPEINREFRDKLEHGLFEDHKGYSDNPLLLSIMLLIYDDIQGLPEKIHKFYQRAYQVLAEEHDRGKDVTRPLATGWSADVFADYFSYFCSITYQKALTSFSRDEMSKYFGDVKKHYSIEGKDVGSFITDLCDNICLMSNNGKTYDFIHRSFQEYFCARFLFSQDEKKLEKVIPLFDRRNKTRDDDKTLMMLYDMEPEGVTNYIFVPYLGRLIDECESGEGIWTFLERMYGSLECGDGEMETRARTAPDSRLYSFIADRYSLRPGPPKLNDYLFFTDEYLEAFGKYKGNTESLKRIMTYAHELTKRPVITGRIYHFDWERLKESEESRKKVEKEDGPFMKEYKAVKELYGKLAGNVEEDPDVFADMF